MMSDRVIYEGVAIGGPLHGEFVNSRFPAGFVLVNRAENLSGVYIRTPADSFVYQHDASYVEDSEKLRQVAEGNNYDVRAM